jgi:hypothetical protein
VRDQERYGLIERPNYAYGLFRAADVARYFELGRVTACEFGVAAGAGLLNLVELADVVTESTGVEIRVVGFDTGTGLPTVEGHKDHPEIWTGGDFPMTDRQALLELTRGKAELVFGDIADTIEEFSASLDASSPLGFASIDVDIYSGARSALRSLLGPAESLLPAVSLYFDDVGFFFANEWCGELAAIHEFNDEIEWRKIDTDRSLPGVRPVIASWYANMYVCHVLDHPARREPRARDGLTIATHYELMKASNLC